MNPNYLDYKKKFDIDGYFIFKNFLNSELVLRLVEDINKAIDVEKYFDNKNNLRRIEKIFNKGKNLIYLNDKILTLLNFFSL